MITNDVEHAEKRAELDRLMNLDPPADSADARRLQALAAELEAYEKQRWPIDEPTATEELEHHLERIREGLACEVDVDLEQLPAVVIGRLVRVLEHHRNEMRWLVDTVDDLRRGLELAAQDRFEKMFCESVDRATRSILDLAASTIPPALANDPQLMRQAFAEASARLVLLRKQGLELAAKLTLAEDTIDRITANRDELAKANAELALELVGLKARRAAE